MTLKRLMLILAAAGIGGKTANVFNLKLMYQLVLWPYLATEP